MLLQMRGNITLSYLLCIVLAFLARGTNVTVSAANEPIEVTVLPRVTYEIPTNSLWNISSIELDLAIQDIDSVSNLSLLTSASSSPSSQCCAISEDSTRLVQLHVFGITAGIASNILKVSRSEFEIYYFYLDTSLSLSIYRVGNSEQTTFKHIGKKPVDFSGKFDFVIDPSNAIDLSTGRNLSSLSFNSGSSSNSSNYSESAKSKFVQFLKLLQWREELLCVIDSTLFLLNIEKADKLIELPAIPKSIAILDDMLILISADNGDIYVFQIALIESNSTKSSSSSSANGKPTAGSISIKKTQRIMKKVFAFESIEVLFDRVYVNTARVIYVYLSTPDSVLAQACRIDFLYEGNQYIESISASREALVAVVNVMSARVDKSSNETLSSVSRQEIHEFLVKRSFLEQQAHPSQVSCFKTVKNKNDLSLPLKQNAVIFDESNLYYPSKNEMLVIRKSIPDALLAETSRNAWTVRYSDFNMQRIQSVVESVKNTSNGGGGGLFLMATATTLSLVQIQRPRPVVKCNAKCLVLGESYMSFEERQMAVSASRNRNSVSMLLVFGSFNCQESLNSGESKQIRPKEGSFEKARSSVDSYGCVFERVVEVATVPFEVNSTKYQEDFMFGISLAGCVGVLGFAAIIFCYSRFGGVMLNVRLGGTREGSSDTRKILPSQNRKGKIASILMMRKGIADESDAEANFDSSNVNVERGSPPSSKLSKNQLRKRSSSGSVGDGHHSMNSSAQILVGSRQSKRKLLNGNSSGSGGLASSNTNPTTHGESEEDEESGISKQFSTKAALAASELTPEEKEAIIISKSKEHQKYLQQVLQDDEFLKLPQEEQDEFLHEQYQFHLDFQRQLKLQNIQRTGGGNTVVIKRKGSTKARDVPVHEKFAEKVDAILETESDKKASTRRGEETLYRMQRRSKLMEHNRNSNWNKFNEWRDEKSNNDRSGRNGHSVAATAGAVAATTTMTGGIPVGGTAGIGSTEKVRSGIPLMTLQSIQKSLALEKGSLSRDADADDDLIAVAIDGGGAVDDDNYNEYANGGSCADNQDDDNDNSGDYDHENILGDEENTGAETKASESQSSSAQSAQASRSSNSEMGSNRISGVHLSRNSCPDEIQVSHEQAYNSDEVHIEINQEKEQTQNGSSGVDDYSNTQNNLALHSENQE